MNLQAVGFLKHRMHLGASQAAAQHVECHRIASTILLCAACLLLL
jgi:hypothetical protein